MAALRIPLVGSLTNRNVNAVITDTEDQQFVNCFPEIIKNPVTGRTTVYLNKRQGTVASAEVQASATGRYGSTIWNSNIAAGGTQPAVVMSFLKSTGSSMMFFATDAASFGTQLGSDVANTSDCLSMGETDISGTGNLTAILLDTSSLEAWFYPSGGSWTQITDSDFPANILPSHAHMDGYMFVMTHNGRIYNSDLNSLSAWSATSYITANSFTDKGVGLVRYKKFIVGFGDSSTEFFVNNGNATGSVLSRVPDATIGIGAMRNGNTIGPAMRAVGDSVYWVGQNPASGARGIYRLNGMQAEKISTPAVDKMVSNGKSRTVIGSFSLLGMTHVAFDAGTLRALCYCVDTGYWWVLQMAATATPIAIAGAVTNDAFSRSYIASSIGAKVYSFNPNSPVWRDDGTGYSLVVRTQNIDLETRRRKFWRSMSIIGDIQESASVLSIAYSDDDYANFSTDQTIDLSTSSNKLTALGSSRRRAWRLTHTANTPCRLEAMELQYDVGAH